MLDDRRGVVGDEAAAIAAMSAITVSRQYGSGGGEVAARLARRLEWDLVDHQLIAWVARALGVSEAEARARDEQVPGFFSRLFDAILLMAPPEVPVTIEELPTDPEQRYHDTVRQAILAAVARRHTVIVGRGGQALLGDRPDVLRVRVVAPLAQRIEYVARREERSPEEARARIRLKEHQRDQYFQTRYNRKPDDPDLYDLVVNTGGLDLDTACDLIVLALTRKGQLLALPPSERGPAAGLARYPGQPQDFRRQDWAED
jgi:cytidylate kinase